MAKNHLPWLMGKQSKLCLAENFRQVKSMRNDLTKFCISHSLENMACQNFRQVKTLGKVLTKFCMRGIALGGNHENLKGF